MRLIVGLGNPGKKYTGTRHNIGFEVVERLAHRLAADPPRERFDSLSQEVAAKGVKLLLLRPLTFMNCSGRAVRAARDFYKMELSDILVVCDDFQLELGTIRFRGAGSAGGQNGLADVLTQLASRDVPRLRLGIGPVPQQWSTVDFVLGRFTAEQRDYAEQAVKRATDGVQVWASEGLSAAMNQFNQTV